jgi:hypothetical protein
MITHPPRSCTHVLPPLTHPSPALLHPRADRVHDEVHGPGQELGEELGPAAQRANGHIRAEEEQNHDALLGHVALVEELREEVPELVIGHLLHVYLYGDNSLIRRKELREEVSELVISHFLHVSPVQRGDNSLITRRELLKDNSLQVALHVHVLICLILLEFILGFQ